MMKKFIFIFWQIIILIVLYLFFGISLFLGLQVNSILGNIGIIFNVLLFFLWVHFFFKTARRKKMINIALAFILLISFFLVTKFFIFGFSSLLGVVFFCLTIFLIVVLIYHFLQTKK